MKKQYDILIADIVIRLVYSSEIQLTPNSSAAFLTKTDTPDIVLNVNVVDTVDQTRFVCADVINSAWEMKNENGGKRFNFHDKSFIVANLFLLNDYSGGDLTIPRMCLHDLLPLINVMTPVLSGYLLKKDIGFLFHGALVDSNGYGIILTGQSGAGKSTLSELMKSCGYDKIGDDRLVLTSRPGQKDAFCYSTPFDLKLTEWVNKKSKVEAIICLKHSANGQNQLKKLNMAKMMGNLVFANFMPLFASEHLKDHFRLCERVFNKISLYEYAFLPDKSSVKYLEESLTDVFRQS